MYYTLRIKVSEGKNEKKAMKLISKFMSNKRYECSREVIEDGICITFCMPKRNVKKCITKLINVCEYMEIAK